VKYELDDDFAQENGLVCGGQMEVFIEPIEPAPSVYVIGAGHVGYYLARFAHEAGFLVHVVDDRDAFANRERFPTATEVVVEDVPAWLTAATLPASSYVVVVTRGHRHDLDAMRAVVGRDLRYVGLIGSRAKVARVYEALVEEGVDPVRFASIHAPIGLDLGAVTPQEIAVSILAELIAVRRGRAADPAVAAASLKWMPKFERSTAGR
jgi:xanthine dehydrogenase accessory factor